MFLLWVLRTIPLPSFQWPLPCFRPPSFLLDHGNILAGLQVFTLSRPYPSCQPKPFPTVLQGRCRMQIWSCPLQWLLVAYGRSPSLSVMHDLASGCFSRWVSCSSLSLTSFQLYTNYPAISCSPAFCMPYPRFAPLAPCGDHMRVWAHDAGALRPTSATRVGWGQWWQKCPLRLREFPPPGCRSRSLSDGLEAPAIGCQRAWLWVGIIYSVNSLSPLVTTCWVAGSEFY